MRIKWLDWLYEFRGRNSIRRGEYHSPFQNFISEDVKLRNYPWSSSGVVCMCDLIKLIFG